jgi:hypothetical protein
MPQNNCDPGRRPFNPALDDESCPKCGVEMEPIDNAVEGLPARRLRLCPECYLVTWEDAAGFQVRQGVPMKKGQSAGWGMGKPN